MGLVVNNVVKMEWDEKGWVQTKAKRDGKSVFILASKEYTNKDGEVIPVFFNGNDAFLWITDANSDSYELWTVQELVSWVKDEYSSRFPNQYDEFIPVEDDGVALLSVLEKWGLEEYADDIVARVKDLAPYSKETIQ